MWIYSDEKCINACLEQEHAGRLTKGKRGKGPAGVMEMFYVSMATWVIHSPELANHSSQTYFIAYELYLSKDDF